MCYAEETWEAEYKKWFEIGENYADDFSFFHAETRVGHTGFWDFEVRSSSALNILAFIALLNEINHNEIPFYVNNSKIRLYSSENIHVELLFFDPNTGEFSNNVIVSNVNAYDGWVVEGIQMGNIIFRKVETEELFLWPISLSDKNISPSFGGFVSGIFSKNKHNPRTTIDIDPFQPNQSENENMNNDTVDRNTDNQDPFLPGIKVIPSD